MVEPDGPQPEIAKDERDCPGTCTSHEGEEQEPAGCGGCSEGGASDAGAEAGAEEKAGGCGGCGGCDEEQPPSSDAEGESEGS